MNPQEVISEKLSKTRLNRTEFCNHLGISDMHLYDLESYENEIEDTLNIFQLFKIACLLEAPVSSICKKLTKCHKSEVEAFNEIKLHIEKTNKEITELSENIGWDLEICALSIEALREQPVMFYQDFAKWFKVEFESITPKIKILT